MDEPWVQDIAGKPFVSVPYTVHLNGIVAYDAALDDVSNVTSLTPMANHVTRVLDETKHARLHAVELVPHARHRRFQRD